MNHLSNANISTNTRDKLLAIFKKGMKMADFTSNGKQTYLLI
jgi:hypothetical protein